MHWRTLKKILAHPEPPGYGRSQPRCTKARHGGDHMGKNPTDRGKNGTKRSLLVEGEAGPVAVVIDGANVHDAKMLGRTINAIVVPRPTPDEVEQHLCLDEGRDATIRPATLRRSPPSTSPMCDGSAKSGLRRRHENVTRLVGGWSNERSVG
jgi:hypothetical protein